MFKSKLLILFYFFPLPLFSCFKIEKMVHKLQQAENQLKSYLVGTDVRVVPADFTVSQSEYTLTIILLSILGGLIMLNIIFYLIYRRVTRIEIKARDMTLKIEPPSYSCSQEFGTIQNEVLELKKCPSETDLRYFHENNRPKRSYYSETDISNCL